MVIFQQDSKQFHVIQLMDIDMKLSTYQSKEVYVFWLYYVMSILMKDLLQAGLKHYVLSGC